MIVLFRLILMMQMPWLNKGIILKKMGKHSDGARCIETAINLYICR